MKIVIVGAGEIGSHLAKMLSHEANDITVIDSDSDRLTHLATLADVATVHGDPSSIRVLREAGVPVNYIFLDGDRKTTRDRILARGESEDCWCMQNIDLCLDAQREDKRARHIDATNNSPEGIVRLILA